MRLAIVRFHMCMLRSRKHASPVGGVALQACVQH